MKAKTTSDVERSKKPNPELATAAAENPESSSSLDDEDRLSGIPEDILHLIISFLYTTQVIKTCLLSTQWRNLWKSHPFIQLYLCPLHKDSKTSIYVDHLLRLRDSNAFNIQNFCLDCYNESNFDQFHQCIVAAAVNQRAQEIDIMVWPSRSKPTTSTIELNKKEDQALLYRYIKLLNGLWNAKNLSIEGCVEIFSWVPNMLNKELHFKRFTTLKYLKLRSTHETSSIQGMTYLLLNSCALVESFEWEVWNRYHAAEKTVEEYLMLPGFKLCCLKLIKVGRLQGHKNELEFLKLLVKSAVVLEEMIITYHKRFFYISRSREPKAIEGSTDRITMVISKYQTIITTLKTNI